MFLANVSSYGIVLVHAHDLVQNITQYITSTRIESTHWRHGVLQGSEELGPAGLNNI
jgi:hypothetical protein